MIKRTLLIGSTAYLSTKDKQMIVRFTADEKASASVPIEDIGVIVLDNSRITLTHRLISKLLDNNTALITCNEQHLPQGLMLNLNGNTVQQERYKYQTEASIPLKKNVWQQTVKAKICNQTALLEVISESNTLLIEKGIKSKSGFENMHYWEKSVRSGDPDNYEARAAAFYWKTIFSDIIPFFKRGRFENAPNNLLNYGYAVLRALTARSLIASGLLPLMAVHHSNKYNAYPLADDIMEPYRPYVDRIVRDMVEKYYNPEWAKSNFKLDKQLKAELLEIPVSDVIIEGKKSPLMNAMQRTTASLYQVFAGNERKVLYPEI